jgi:hypothetical protein
MPDDQYELTLIKLLGRCADALERIAHNTQAEIQLPESEFRPATKLSET